MHCHSASVEIKTRGFSDVHNLTPVIQNALAASGYSDGIVTAFVPGSTAGITTIEFESGVIDDLQQAIERLVPQNIPYRHNARWSDGNGFSHVRAALLGPSLSVPFSRGELDCGTWQQIILIDFDNRPRTREILIRILGE
jgi:secondary thiamine-phosphate synthase enzyme